MSAVNSSPLTIPPPLYVYNRDFDYLSYLETQSHFEQLSFEVDQSILRSISANERIGRQIGGAISSLEQTVSNNMSLVAEALNEINQSISEGFAAIDSQLSQVNSTLGVTRQRHWNRMH